MCRNQDLSLESNSNDEVIAVDQASVNNDQLYRSEGQLARMADVSETADRYLTLLIFIAVRDTVAADIGEVIVSEFWSHRELGSQRDSRSGVATQRRWPLSLLPHGLR